MKKNKRFVFTIPIGDWSGDGHSQKEVYHASANASSIEEIREAYFAAKKKLPEICPEKICSKYEESMPTETQLELLKKHKAPLPSDKYFIPLDMTHLVIWYINQGNSELDVKFVKEKELPSLAFYGFDSKKRYIDFIGYGLFS